MELIAMRCTREQYESVKDKVGELKWISKYDFNDYEYLCNTTDFEGIFMCEDPMNHRKFYEQFDKEILFKALDIEVEESFKISKETVLKYDMREEFPECFEVKLEVGNVYRNVGTMFLCTGFSEKLKPYGYGFSCDNLFLEDCRKYTWGTDCVKEATQKEWVEALIKEAGKKFKEGDCIKQPKYNTVKTIDDGIGYFYFKDYDQLTFNGWTVYSQGIWAEIIPSEITQNGLTYILKK